MSRWNPNKKRCTIKELAEYFEISYARMRRLIRVKKIDLRDTSSIFAFIEHVNEHPQILKQDSR